MSREAAKLFNCSMVAGFTGAIDGKPRREVVDLAIAALKAVWHRGAVDADGRGSVIRGFSAP